jgi:hypothetical protein
VAQELLKRLDDSARAETLTVQKKEQVRACNDE